MIATHRRINIAQAFKIASKQWCTITDLRCGGAYGTTLSIHRAIRKMMLKEDAAAMAKTADGWIYRITPMGYAKLGMVPHKTQGEGNGKRDHKEGAELPRD